MANVVMVAADAPALPPCNRCGTFADLADFAGERMCAPCVERTGHAVLREPFGLFEVFRGTLLVIAEVGLRARADRQARAHLVVDGGVSSSCRR